jgi:hypothetical protein
MKKSKKKKDGIVDVYPHNYDSKALFKCSRSRRNKIKNRDIYGNNIDIWQRKLKFDNKDNISFNFNPSNPKKSTDINSVLVDFTDTNNISDIDDLESEIEKNITKNIMKNIDAKFEKLNVKITSLQNDNICLKNDNISLKNDNISLKNIVSSLLNANKFLYH